MLRVSPAEGIVDQAGADPDPIATVIVATVPAATNPIVLVVPIED